MSSNPSIAWEIVRANPDKPWDWFHLSCNPSVTWEVVQANPDKPWRWDVLSRRRRMLVTEEDDSRICKTRLLITRFQRRWRECITDPSHPFCRRRLEREWEEVSETTPQKEPPMWT